MRTIPVSYTHLTGGENFKVTGLLKDFQIQTFTSEKKPFMAIGKKPFYGVVHLRLKEPFIDNLQKLNKAAKEAFPDKTIDFGNYQQVITDQYNSVRVFRNATLMAAMTMFFIMLMGLIGYTTDEVYRRSKEIAIRKVNGAEASMILELLSRDILYVAVPAVFIGTIAAWYVNTLWMEQFTEQIPLGWIAVCLLYTSNRYLLANLL